MRDEKNQNNYNNINDCAAEIFKTLYKDFHACGGDEARKKKGSYSVLARDLIDGIGQCLKNAEERL